ncbi:acyltransferase [Massilia sp. erpn]|uniref:acyltransferase family protein n=1 Tax=Massilia sp. erpn TaxID=2738142 RepID=UPI0021057708|nr:acyltransferase [Massilia sp. erpn]UTY55798.1 acyltransferase [Massilia sp. erpn]
MNHNKFAFLDGLRGMAAIFVLTRHTGDLWHINFFHSYLAVDLFFILSGFVIAYAYDEKLRSGVMGFGNFVLTRLIRLYPVYLLSLLLCTAVWLFKAAMHKTDSAWGTEEILLSASLAAFFLPSQLGGGNSLFAINGPYWSLFYELVVNILYAACRRWLSTGVLGAVIVLSGGVVTASALHNGTLDIGYSWGTVAIAAGFCRALFGISLGLLLFRKKTPLLQALSGWTGAAALPWLSFLLVAIVLALPDAAAANAWIDLLAVLIVFPAAVLLAALPGRSRLQGGLLALGSASYPLYVLHIPLGMLASALLKKWGAKLAPFSGISFVAVLILLSLLLEKRADIPLRRWLSQRLLPAKPAKALGAAA